MAVIYHRSRPRSPRWRFTGAGASPLTSPVAPDDDADALPLPVHANADTGTPAYASVGRHPIYTPKGIAPPTSDQQVPGDTTGLGVLLEPATIQ
jgi:hypothetical protein